MSELAYLRRDKGRQGEPRIYVRRFGRSIRLREPEGSAAFAKEYAAALALIEQGPKKPTPKEARASKLAPRARSLGWLAMKYFASNEFKALASGKTRRAVIESCLRERHKGKRMRDCPIEAFTPAKVKALRDAKGELKGAANNRRKYLSAMFGWAVEEGLAPSNPCRDVRRIKYATDGFHTWTIDELKQFEEHYPIGTKERLAFALLAFLGVRSCDVVTLGRQHVKRGFIRFVPRKTRYQRLDAMELPIIPALSRVLDASPTGDLTFLQTEYGRPFSVKGFGGWFRERCSRAGLPHCGAHGVRKGGASLAAERGATVHQLMAIYGWKSPAQAEPYTRAADRKRLAMSAMNLLSRD